MRRAWKVDLFSGTISPIPAKGIACVNEGLWCLNDVGFRSFYGSNGSYAGSSITRNGHTTVTDGGGRYVGSSIIRRALVRRDAAEDDGRTPDTVTRFVSSLPRRLGMHLPR